MKRVPALKEMAFKSIPHQETEYLERVIDLPGMVSGFPAFQRARKEYLVEKARRQFMKIHYRRRCRSPESKLDKIICTVLNDPNGVILSDDVTLADGLPYLSVLLTGSLRCPLNPRLKNTPGDDSKITLSIYLSRNPDTQKNSMYIVFWANVGIDALSAGDLYAEISDSLMHDVVRQAIQDNLKIIDADNNELI
ncbi:MAG: hypothetical protein ACYCOU_03215 [Sulfobacillus sp.]